MNRLYLFTSVIFTILVGINAYGQEKCQVLKPAISGTYSGDCKKGLANGKGIATGIDSYEGQFKNGLPDGKGTYTWSTGEIYTGQWKEGKRNGIGKYTYIESGKDGIKDGQWVDDQYAGPVVPKPYIKTRDGVERYTLQKNGNKINRVSINIYQNGARNATITNQMLNATSGYESGTNGNIVYEGVVFPATFKVSYTTMNKLRTGSINVRFEFEIYEPGDWKVDIHN